ncbi:Uncharacterised protein [Mycolicibacterium vanbaalenii]|uniref:Uncharacterized protein n=1 Tax=Mycolicibacterium vanbaalenii TaxID=110539 RepID=A0A5S9NLV1_MYCVN|nr:Uncharacterised protein [Mycolicibacterium vanbaalenii]
MRLATTCGMRGAVAGAACAVALAGMAVTGATALASAAPGSGSAAAPVPLQNPDLPTNPDDPRCPAMPEAAPCVGGPFDVPTSPFDPACISQPANRHVRAVPTRCRRREPARVCPARFETADRSPVRTCRSQRGRSVLGMIEHIRGIAGGGARSIVDRIAASARAQNQACQSRHEPEGVPPASRRRWSTQGRIHSRGGHELRARRPA